MTGNTVPEIAPMNTGAPVLLEGNQGCQSSCDKDNPALPPAQKSTPKTPLKEPVIDHTQNIAVSEYEGLPQHQQTDQPHPRMRRIICTSVKKTTTPRKIIRTLSTRNQTSTSFSLTPTEQPTVTQTPSLMTKTNTTHQQTDQPHPRRRRIVSTSKKRTATPRKIVRVLSTPKTPLKEPATDHTQNIAFCEDEGLPQHQQTDQPHPRMRRIIRTFVRRTTTPRRIVRTLSTRNQTSTSFSLTLTEQPTVTQTPSLSTKTNTTHQQTDRPRPRRCRIVSTSKKRTTTPRRMFQLLFFSVFVNTSTYDVIRENASNDDNRR